MGGETFRFSDYFLDVERRELRFSGEEIELQPRVFDLLLYLVRHRDRAVDKDELMAAVWPGMVVTETALTRAVMKARKAVGDDAGTQAMIKTLHGHGYRFVAALEAVDDDSPGPAIDDTVPGESPGLAAQTRRRVLAVAVAALAVLAILLLVWKPWRAAADDGKLRVAVLPVVDTTGDPNLSWVRLGLMSYVSNLLQEEGAIQTVADGNMLTLAEAIDWDGTFEGEGAADLLLRLRELYGATHLLTMELRPDRTRLRMNYALWDGDGRERQGTMVGGEGPELAMGVVQSVYGLLLKRSRLAGSVELVSSDPFNNEAFARGMSLSLEGRCAEAERYFRVILEQEPELFEPRHELAACLRILGQPDEAESMLVALVDEQTALGADRKLAQAAMTLGVLYNRTGRLEQAQASHELALAAAGRAGDHEQAGRILNNLAIVAKDLGDPGRANDLLDRAILEYRQGGREILPGQVFSLQANLAMAQGRLAEADGYLQQALASFQAVGDRRSQAMMLNNTGYLRRLQGRPAEAESFHLQSLAIRQEIGDRVGVGRVNSMLAVAYSAQGKYAEAREAALAGLEIARESRDRLFEASLNAQLGDAEGALGHTESARQAFQAGREIFIEIGDRPRTLQSDLKLAALDLDEGRIEEARSTVRNVLAEARSAEFLQAELDAMEMLGDAALADGDSAQAEMAYQDTLDRLRETSWEGREIRLSRKLAEVLMDRGDLETAEPLVGRLSGLEADSASLLTQARYAFLTGAPERARKLAQEAKTLAGAGWSPEDAAVLDLYARSVATEPRPGE